MNAFELSALLPGLCVPGPQNWDLTVVSENLNHAVGYSLILFHSNGQSTYAKYPSGYCWGL